MKQKSLLNAKDFGTPELHKQRDVRIENGVAIVTNSVPVVKYHRDRKIDDDQFNAAIRLESSFMLSGLFNLKISRITDQKGIRRFAENESLADSYEKEYRLALKNMSWDSRQITINVCCFHECIEYSPRLFSKFKQGLNQLYEIFRTYDKDAH